jgi:outer membrane protein TolC
MGLEVRSTTLVTARTTLITARTTLITARTTLVTARADVAIALQFGNFGDLLPLRSMADR